jgi:hypothetical protein
MDDPQYLDWQQRKVQHPQEHGRLPEDLVVDAVETSTDAKDDDLMEIDDPATGTPQDAADMNESFDFDKYEGKTTDVQELHRECENEVLTPAQSKKCQTGSPLEPLVRMSKKGRTFQVPPLSSLRPLLPKPTPEGPAVRYDLQASGVVQLEKSKSSPPRKCAPKKKGRTFIRRMLLHNASPKQRTPPA